MNKRGGTFIVVGWALLNTISARPLVFEPDSKFWFEGDSSLHPFLSSLTEIEKSLFVSTNSDITSLNVSIPIKYFKSKTKKLDTAIYKSFDVKNHPNIEFALKQREDNLLSGFLHLHGVSKPVTLNIVRKKEDGMLVIQGKKRVKMSDFNIKPPTFMLVLKTSDDIDIYFDLKAKLSQ